MGSEGQARGSAAMQGAQEDRGGAAGAAEGPGVQGIPHGTSAQGGPGGPNPQNVPDAQGGPGGPNPQDVPDAQGGPGGPNVQGGPNAQGGPGGPGGPRDPCRERGEGTAARGGCRVPRAPPAPGPGGDIAPVARGPRSRLMEFSLSVPFRSPLEAEMARRSLTPAGRRQRQGQGIQKELTVTGSVLAVRWTAEDPVTFRISVNAFLDQLSLVMRNIERIRPAFPLSLGREKGTET